MSELMTKETHKMLKMDEKAASWSKTRQETTTQKAKAQAQKEQATKRKWRFIVLDSLLSSSQDPCLYLRLSYQISLFTYQFTWDAPCNQSCQFLHLPYSVKRPLLTLVSCYTIIRGCADSHQTIISLTRSSQTITNATINALPISHHPATGYSSSNASYYYKPS